jgi:hypothetical protein
MIRKRLHDSINILLDKKKINIQIIINTLIILLATIYCVCSYFTHSFHSSIKLKDFFDMDPVQMRTSLLLVICSEILYFFHFFIVIKCIFYQKR